MHPIAVNYSGRRRSVLITKEGLAKPTRREQEEQAPTPSSLCGLALMKTC